MALKDSILKNILNLKKIYIEKIEIEKRFVSKYGESYEQDILVAYARPYKKDMCKCPVCKNKCSGYDTKYETESSWRLPNINGIPTYLKYQPKRVECPEHGVLTEYLPWTDGSSRFTEDFNNEVAWLVTQASKTAISTYLGINWRTVGNCIKAAHRRIEPDVSERIHSGLKRICVDETSYKKGHSYITVVYDMERNRVVWLHDGHGENIFREFCEQLSQEERDAIEIVAGDGAKWIDSCTKKYLKNAKRCVDFFHVAEWANEAIDKTRLSTARKAHNEYEKMKAEFRCEEEEAKAVAKARMEELDKARQEMEKLPKRGRPSKRKNELKEEISKLEEEIGTDNSESQEPSKKGRPKKETFTKEHEESLNDAEKLYERLKGAKYALGKRPENRTENQDDVIDLIENSFPDLYKAWQCKENLRIILHMKDAELAEIKLTEWITQMSEQTIAPLVSLGEKIERHKDNILNSIRYQANSAKSEAANTSIKALIKTARGFRNMDNMFALIYLKCSDLVIPLNNRPQPSAELRKEQRERANRLKRERELKNGYAMA